MSLNLLSINHLGISLKFSVDGKDRLFKSRNYFINKMWYKTHQINVLIYFLEAMYSTALIFKPY